MRLCSLGPDYWDCEMENALEEMEIEANQMMIEDLRKGGEEDISAGNLGTVIDMINSIVVAAYPKFKRIVRTRTSVENALVWIKRRLPKRSRRRINELLYDYDAESKAEGHRLEDLVFAQHLLKKLAEIV